MTENEAINVLKMVEAHGCLVIESKVKAIQALEEIQQYRAIGTVEECRTAVEITKMRKPYKGRFGAIICSLCGEKVGQIVTGTLKGNCLNFCGNCGSKVDWSE